MITNKDDFAELMPTVICMSGFTSPWLVAGGWTIDLYLGRKSREHDDVDISIFRADQREMQTYLAGWHMQKVSNRKMEDWEAREWLELPIHEIHVHRNAGDPDKLEILLDERDGDIWRYRKNLQVTRPVERMAMRTPEGIPFLGPEVALLYKASYFYSANPLPEAAREKDWSDFERAARQMEAERREWLEQAIEICYPGHSWLAELSKK